MNRLLTGVAAVVGLAVLAGQAAAQYESVSGYVSPGPRTGYPGRYYSGYWGYWPYQDAYNGYLTGAAAVIDSQANFMVARSKAELIRQQARQAKIDTERKLYEEWKYKRNDQPTLEQLRRQAIDEAWQRAVYHPPLNDIWSADALNRILDHASRSVGQDTRGATIPLDGDLLKKINVSTGVPGSAGLLKDKGKLSWPDALRGADLTVERDRFSQLTEEAVRQATFNNKVDKGTLDAMQSTLATIELSLRARLTKCPSNDYLEARRYVDDLNQALRTLQRPDAADYLNGNYTAQGKDVGELIRHMTSRGLRFAPAVPGGEAAYNALYKAMVAYDLGLVRKQASME
jgi:hypothetical protein